MRRFYYDLLDTIDENITSIGIIFIINVIFIMILVSADQERKWEHFRIAHNCKITQKDAGSVGLGYATNGSGGVVFTESSPRVAWLCDDGITYWRDE